MESGDPEKYIQLIEDKKQLENVRRYYLKMSESIRKGSGVDSAECDRLYNMAKQEMEDIQGEYSRKFTELLQPLIELSKEYKVKYDFMKLARIRIGKLSDRFDSYLLHYQNIGSMDCYYMDVLDKILQSTVYINNADVDKKNIFPRTDNACV